MKYRNLRIALTPATVLICMSIAAAHAGDNGKAKLHAPYQTCIDNSGGVTSQMLDCNGREMDYQDKRLNRLYQALVHSLPPQDVVKLRAQERAWIARREKHCAPDPDGGTAADINSSSCEVDETTEQANKLETLLQK